MAPSPISSRSPPSSPESRTSSTSSSSPSPQKKKNKKKKKMNSSSVRSPTSIIQQWQSDAKGAMEDAYANFVLGDDAGESARLVLVATPSEDVVVSSLTSSSSPPSSKLVSSSSAIQTTSTRTTAIPTATATTAHSSRRNLHNTASPSLIHVANSRKPTPSFHSCGVTFVEINGRAYVQALETTSAAYKAGVLPEDCVQYAAVLAKEWEQPLGNDFAAISQQALERERKGQRITFAELKRVLLHGSGVLQLLDEDIPGGGGGGDDPNGHPNSGIMGRNVRPTVPTTIRIGKVLPVTNPCGPSTVVQDSNERDYDDDDDDDDDMINPVHGGRNNNNHNIKKTTNNNNNNNDPRPVVLVFRRTRQRPRRLWNVWPNYRLDDECDVACQILEHLTTTTIKKNQDSNNNHHDQKNDESLEELNVEASTIRGMIQKAVGLAFVRTNKVVFGVSLAGGSGIVVSRLNDGTWSAPSCIGMMGVGLGLQVGLEVANYIFILQTREALEHFQRGGSFTVGANVGAALAGMGREAVGAASVSSAFCGMASPQPIVKEDEYTFEDGPLASNNSNNQRMVGRKHHHGSNAAAGVAPIVAYAKSEGLYVGVSLEGSRIFTREELNARAYKFSSYNHKQVSAQDILTGKIQQRPAEAESLYALLHAIEFTHEISTLPPLPRCKLLMNRTKRKDGTSITDWSMPWNASMPPYIKNEDGDVATQAAKDDNDNNDDELDQALIKDEMDEYNEKFQQFLLGGVTVERIAPNKREKRTLWLYAPQEGSLRMGFVSKLFSSTSRTTHLSTPIIQDFISPKATATTNTTAIAGSGASAVSDMEGDEVTLDSALMDNQSLLTTTGTLREKVELSKKLSLDVVDVVSLSQTAPANIQLRDSNERRRLVCIESQDVQLIFLGGSIEETRVLYCGLKVLLEKETARLGVRGGQGRGKRSIPSALRNNKNKSHKQQYQINRKSSGYASSEIDDTDDLLNVAGVYLTVAAEQLPEGWKSWGRLPGRAYMRDQASSNEDGYPTYVHGQLLVRDLCKNVLPLCRVLLLDSSSPVISKWENDRDDMDFERTPWTFPPATPREREQFQSEHQLIASGSMCGAHRTISYQRYRNGQLVRLSETHIVDSDDTEKLAFSVTERLPRRGFSIKVKILLRAVENGGACEATVLGEIRPVGKNMSDPAAVHKAFLLVLDELRNRYGTDSGGLLAGFTSVIEDMAKGNGSKGLRSRGHGSSRYNSSSRGTSWEEKKDTDSMERTSVVKFEDVMNAEKNLGMADVSDTRFGDEKRPSTPSPRDITEGRYKASRKSKSKPLPGEDSFSQPSEPVTIEVKPLPKIRLSLMPSPREEDEEDLDEEGEPISKNKNSSSTKSRTASRKVAWSKSRRSSKNRLAKD
ncbi:Las17-binding protein actin regulator [Nitzschia inconspicua]|uniref:Las17-binding protein actin regulator n=1 Tax=Nitzschia inconspicua TaxID=303405 RepID=A0A9K3KRX8_9STRA|nr:Las17-binding protein actin regulator [Nitzschia inconspicua]